MANAIHTAGDRTPYTYLIRLELAIYRILWSEMGKRL